MVEIMAHLCCIFVFSPIFFLRVLLLSKLKKRQYLNIKKKNVIYNYNFLHTLLTMF